MISAILPVRNGDLGQLRRAVSSVLRQSYKDFELLIIDDGSEEEFAKELDILSASDDRIRLFHIQPSGVSVARNTAINMAEGDIVTFIDGDDTIAPFAFEEAAEVLRDKDIEVLFGGTLYVEESDAADSAEPDVMKNAAEPASQMNMSGDEKKKDVFGVENSSGEERITSDKLQKSIIRISGSRLHKTRAEVIGEPYRFENGGYINRGIAARFIRREVFSDKRFLFPKGIKMYEDAIWNLRMIDSLKVAYVKRIWYYYYENAASASNKYNPEVIRDMERPLRIMRKILDLSDTAEYSAYTRLVMDSLRYIYLCMYGNPKWDEGKAKKRSVRRHLYKAPLWKEIGSRKFRKYSEKRDRQKALLYKLHLLFLYWKITWQ